MDRVNSPRLFLFTQASLLDTYATGRCGFFSPCSRKRSLFPDALGKCITLHMKECIYRFCICLVALWLCIPPPSSFRPYGTCTHLPVFCFSITRSSSFIHPPPCPSPLPPGAVHASQRYCFSNLADRGQYLCIVFRYSFLLLTHATDRPPTQQTGTKHTSLPCHLVKPMCVFSVRNPPPPTFISPTTKLVLLYF